MPISQESLDFLFTNYATDSREWFTEHRDDYQRLVVTPLAELVTRLTPGMLEIDSALITEPKVDRTISRIHRDMRIPQNRSRGRYRPNCWILFIRDKKLYNGLPAFYMEMDPAGFTYGMGYYQASTDTMRLMREMILAGEPAAKKAISAYERQDVFELEGEEFKRPKYPDKPEKLRLWLEKKSFSFVRRSGELEQLFSDDLADTLMDGFRKLAPIYDFFLAVEARRQKEQ